MSVCIYYNTGGYILEGSNFHIHRVTYTNIYLCVSSHMRVPRLFPNSDSCFPVGSQASWFLQHPLKPAGPVKSIKGFFSRVPPPPCFPSQVYLKCSFLLIVGLPQIQNCVPPLGFTVNDLLMLHVGNNLPSISH